MQIDTNQFSGTLKHMTTLFHKFTNNLCNSNTQNIYCNSSMKDPTNNSLGISSYNDIQLLPHFNQANFNDKNKKKLISYNVQAKF